MRFFSPRLDTLPPPQKELWPELAPLKTLGFVLHGGTAIALRLGHRVSVDFDFFSDGALVKGQLFAECPFLRGTSVIQEGPSELSVITPSVKGFQSVKLSFFGGIDFGRIGEPQETDDGVATVASLEDLVAQKLKTILQRLEAKDYRDVAAMLRSGVSLEKGLAGARALFGSTFEPAVCLKALVCFEGGDLGSLPREDRDTLIEAVRRARKLPVVGLAARTIR